MGYIINIDTGGTFTDGYVTGPAGVIRAKVETTPHDVTVGIVDCIDRAASLLGFSRAELLRRTDVIRFSTTIGTNVLINRTGPKIGLLLGESLHQVFLDTLPPGLPLQRELIETVPEVGKQPDHRAIIMAVHSLLEHGARIIVIALAGGQDLAKRETAVRTLIAADYPRHYLGAVPVLPSHQVTLSLDPLIRIRTAILNAYLHPTMSRALYRIEDQLRREGYRYPLLVANADATTSRVAKTIALRTWGSGPAGGVAGAANIARRLALKHVVTLDVGGTSSDISILRNGQWEYAVEPHIEGIKVALPSVELESIGIGGGSIARVVDGKIEVGPESAGGQPGPASFGRGGTHATVTDAVCCLGIFDPHHFLGGRKILNIEAARAAVQAQVAEPLGVGVEKAAAQMLHVAAERIAMAVGRLLESQGIAPDDCVLFTFGGAGGLFAHAAAQRIGMGAAYAFSLNPVFSAFGLSTLDIAHAYEALPGDDLSDSLQTLKTRAIQDMRGEGVDTEKIRLRIEGELADSDGAVAVVDLGSSEDEALAAARLHREADRLRLVRLRAWVPGVRAQLPTMPQGELSTVGERLIFWDGVKQSTPIFDWDAAPAGSLIPGPALLESSETTLVIPPRSTVMLGNLGEAVFMFR